TLATALCRLGSTGNAVSLGCVARKFGVSEGTVELFTGRVIVALLSLEKDIVRWPTNDEKRVTKQRIKAKHHFPSCLGYVDGTDIVLAYKPAVHGEDYFSRKKVCSLPVMVVCDYDWRILYTCCGFTGSAHDSRVYKSTDLYRNPEKYFENDEYLLGDSAYTCTTTVITPYRKSEKTSNRDNRHFSKLHSGATVGIENTIGITKNRFQALKGLRVLIKSKKDHTRTVYWFRICAILYNICIEFNARFPVVWSLCGNSYNTVIARLYIKRT
ncbi:uncharacterized protein LOC129596781, partial [Paramacrobiotus metropolitanus]|uniref:uncharacterized protein LOC129596781 n=1 Tax=Paramacrobiotus metropolitanus TaxID=2943436 RepID=UPI002445EFC4